MPRISYFPRPSILRFNAYDWSGTKLRRHGTESSRPRPGTLAARAHHSCERVWLRVATRLLMPRYRLKYVIGPRDFVPLGTLSSTGLNARDPRMGISQSAVPPPSTTNVAPVMNDESSEARKSTALAISSGVPTRPKGRFAHPAI